MGRPRPIRIRPDPARRGVDGLPNLGPKSAAWLADVGVTTREQLARVGPLGACRLLRAAGRPVSLLLAYAIEGALTGRHWARLDPATREILRAGLAGLRREPAPAPRTPPHARRVPVAAPAAVGTARSPRSQPAS